ncbi:MAG: DUF4468 domain-containing protein [Saprospiraceae bacterium]|nr:DUF4468 domain-containing protein [Saprospiraceae bacterium]
MRTKKAVRLKNKLINILNPWIMLKKSLLLSSLLLISPVFLLSQEKYDEKKEVYFQEVFEFDTTKDIYSLSKKWFSDMFISGKAVIDYDDKNSGEIIGKGNSTYAVYNKKKFVCDIDLHFTISIETKKGKSRVTFTNIYTRGIEYPFYERTAGYWFGPLCKGCKQYLNDWHKTQIRTTIKNVCDQYQGYLKKERDDF